MWQWLNLEMLLKPELNCILSLCPYWFVPSLVKFSPCHIPFNVRQPCPPTHHGWRSAAKQTEYPRVRVGVVLGKGGVDPVMSRQDVLIEPRIHPLPWPAGRERSSTSHEGVEDGKGVEVGV